MRVAKRVLLIESDSDVRSMSARVLSGEGFDVVEHPSGQAALDWLAGRTDLPDAVVLDVEMPDADGWALLEWLRSTERTRSIPVLLCASQAAGVDDRRARSAGADAYLPKPFTVDRLATAVRGLIADDGRDPGGEPGSS